MVCALEATVNTGRAVGLTTAYVRERAACGRPLFDLQNTHFVLADAKTQAIVARTFIDGLMERLLADDLDAATAAAAKLWTTETQCKVIGRASGRERVCQYV